MINRHIPTFTAKARHSGGYRFQAQADERTATLHIYEAIGGWFGVDAAQLVRDLHALGDLDAIDVFINSPGGDAFDGVAIYNALRRNTATVNVHVDGLAASAASLIAMAGDTITMARGSEMMIHDASAMAWGDAALMRETAGLLDKLSDSYADCYAARAGGTSQEWRDVMRAETWYTAAEAVKAGLADRTDDEKDGAEAKARFDLSVFAHAGRADAPAPVLPVSAATHIPPVRSEPGQPNTERTVDMADSTFLAGLRERLGITDAEADETAILAALEEALAEQATEPEPAPEAKLPEGVTTIEVGALDDLRTRAAKAEELLSQAAKAEREQLVAAAIEDGRIAVARKDHWLKALEADEGAADVLASLETGLIPLAEIGRSDDIDVDPEAAAEEAAYNKLYGKDA